MNDLFQFETLKLVRNVLKVQCAEIRNWIDVPLVFGPKHYNSKDLNFWALDFKPFLLKV